MLRDWNRPVDVSAKEAEVSERLEKDREHTKERVIHSMSRTSSRNASQREMHSMSRTSSRNASTREHHSPRGHHTPIASPSSPKFEPSHVTSSHNGVRPSFSFANAAAATKKDSLVSSPGKSDTEVMQGLVEEVAEVEL